MKVFARDQQAGVGPRKEWQRQGLLRGQGSHLPARQELQNGREHLLGEPLDERGHRDVPGHLQVGRGDRRRRRQEPPRPGQPQARPLPVADGHGAVREGIILAGRTNINLAMKEIQ